MATFTQYACVKVAMLQSPCRGNGVRRLGEFSSTQQSRPPEGYFVRSSFRKLALLLASAATACGISVSLPSVAQADPPCAEGEQVHFDEVSGELEKTNRFDDNRPGYRVDYHWCTADGDVVGFVVTNVVEDTGVKVDIRPKRPLVWGPEYPIFVHVTGNNTEVDDWNITLRGDGGIDKPDKAS